MTDRFGNAELSGSVKGRSVRGAAKVLAGQAASVGIGLGATAVLARLLDPADFGLMAMAVVLINFAALFREAGLGTSSVRADRMSHETLSALFWINLGIGILLAVVVALLGPLWAWFLGEPRLAALAALLAPSLFFFSAGVQHAALLKRRFRMGTLTLLHNGSVLAAALVAIGLAARGFGFWALAWQRLLQAVFLAAATWLASPWRPGKPRMTAEVRAHLQFGRALTVTNILQFLNRNADNVLLGRFCGQAMLGLYSRAYNLLLFPIRQINSPLNHVVLPMLARMRNHPERFAAYYYRALESVTFITMPLVAMAIAAARELILLCLGTKFTGSIPVFLCLAPAAFMGSFNMATAWTYHAWGHVARELKVQMVSTIVGLTAIGIGLQWGGVGVACAISAVSLTIRLPQLAVCYRGTPITLRGFARAVGGQAVASGLSLGVTLGVAHVWLPSNILLALTVKCVIFGLCFLASNMVMPHGVSRLRRLAGTVRALVG